MAQENSENDRPSPSAAEQAAREREIERVRELNQQSRQNNATPAEEHRGGPLPNQKR